MFYLVVKMALGLLKSLGETSFDDKKKQIFMKT